MGGREGESGMLRERKCEALGEEEENKRGEIGDGRNHSDIISVTFHFQVFQAWNSKQFYLKCLLGPNDSFHFCKVLSR